MEKGKIKSLPSVKQSPNVQKTQKNLIKLGFSSQIIELKIASVTTYQIVKAIGCQIGQVAKSVIFKSNRVKKPVLVIASSVNQVSEKTIADHFGEPVKKADPDFVLEKTGFLIGGVPPIGHVQPIKTYIDLDLFRYHEIWASGGSPKAVFKLTPRKLIRMTRGKLIKVT